MRTLRFALLCVSMLAVAGCDETPRPAPLKKEPLPDSSLHAPIKRPKRSRISLRAKQEQDARIEEQGG